MRFSFDPYRAGYDMKRTIYCLTTQAVKAASVVLARICEFIDANVLLTVSRKMLTFY